MGRRRFSVEDNGALTDDGRCYQSDCRRWRCPIPSLPNKIYCEHHRSLSSRKGAKAVSDSELSKPNPIADSNPKTGELRPNVDPPLMTDNGSDQSSDQSVVLAMAAESESKGEKLNCTLNALVRNKKKRRSEKKETDADPTTEDLLRMAVKRQMERREEKEEKKRGDRRRRGERRKSRSGDFFVME